MKTNKQRLMNIIATMSVAINLVMLGGLAYIAVVDTKVNQVYTAMKLPVVVYVPKAVANAGVTPAIEAVTTK